jgi:hypothetical protein
MGDLEQKTRLRYQEYRNKLELASVETTQYKGLFDQFGAVTETQQRALILCRIAEGQTRSLGYAAASEYYKQALEIDPRCQMPPIMGHP